MILTFFLWGTEGDHILVERRIYKKEKQKVFDVRRRGKEGGKR